MKPTLIDDERGMATLTTAAVITALMSVVTVLAVAAGSSINSHRAQVVADLAAIHAVHARWLGEDACAAGEEVIAANGARFRLRHCHVEGADVILEVASGRSSAAARAGPL